MSKPVFSIILPLWKQGDHLDIILQTYLDGFINYPDSCEFIFVVNGPDEGQYDKVRQFAQKHEAFSVYKIPNAQWGKAVMTGFKYAKGDYLCLNNSARTNIKDLYYVLNLAKRNPDVVVKITRIIRENFIRFLGSFLYNLECHLLLKTSFWDINAAPKILPRTVYEKVKNSITETGVLFDAQLMTEINKRQIPVMEVPIVTRERLGGKSTTQIKMGIGMYIGLIALSRKIRITRKNFAGAEAN